MIENVVLLWLKILGNKIKIHVNLYKMAVYIIKEAEANQTA